MHVISRLFNKYLYIFIQCSWSDANMQYETLSLNQLTAIYSFC